MVIGYILINTTPAMEHEVYKELLKIKEIIELYPLFGEYDFIAKVDSKDLNGLGRVVVDNIRIVKGVIYTKTLTGMPSIKPRYNRSFPLYTLPVPFRSLMTRS